MKQIVTTQPVKIESVEYPAGTKLAKFETLPGVSLDYVFGCLTSAKVKVEEEDGSEFIESVVEKKQPDPKPDEVTVVESQGVPEIQPEANPETTKPTTNKKRTNR